MRPLNKPDITIAKKENSRKSKKNLSRTTPGLLYFQIGLIIALVSVLFVFESQWSLSARTDVAPPTTFYIDPAPTTYVLAQKPPAIAAKKPPKAQRVVLPKPAISKFIPIASTVDIIAPEVPSAEISNTRLVPASSPASATPRKATNLLAVERVPVYPGCETLSSNQERIQCFQERIQQFVSKRFRVDRFIDTYPGERKRIHVEFTISETGEISRINAVSRESNDLAIEAVRVIQELPRMTPGMQHGKTVAVQYALPITLQIAY